MPRVLGATERNELHINDNLSGGEIVLFYRNPTTKERMGYSNKSIQRKGNKVQFRHVEVRHEYGAKILTGFREGDFVMPNGGENVPISSDPSSKNYTPDWKELVMKYAADCVELLAIRVFDGSVEISSETDDDEPADDGGADPAGDEDLEGNFKET